MKKILGIVASIVFLASAAYSANPKPAFVLPTCLQDQYGNQYSQLVTDSVHNIITGVVTNVEGSCSAQPWTMVGSWTIDSTGRIVLELSVADNAPSAECVTVYKLRGNYPKANWFYDTGFGENQPFQYAACSANSPVADDTPQNSHARGTRRGLEK